MIKLLYITLMIALSGCTGIARYNYHSITDTSKYIDCGAFLGEPRAGGIWRITGTGNYTEIKENNNDILVCSKGLYKESMYLIGPIIPIIPVFGLGNSELPDYIEFSIVNKSKTKEIVFKHDYEIYICIRTYKKSGRCYDYVRNNYNFKIPSNSVLNLQMKYQNEIILKLELDNGNNKNIKFNNDSGTFLIFTG